jgi:mannose-6-phosphate isomerase
MYPLKFKPVYFEKIWGGRGLERFKKDLPEGNIGESWELSCHKNGLSIIENGIYKGKTLKEVTEIEGEKLLGRNIDLENFPILIKFISAEDNLSIQVHPNNEYARAVENESGKSELWYILKAEKGSNIILGNKHCSKEEFKSGIISGDLERYLNVIEVKEGEAYYVSAGLLHAIGNGIVLVEIQQSSDVTYRVYDYDRGREIHIDKALDVINLDVVGERLKESKESFKGYNKINYGHMEYFSVEKYEINDILEEESCEESFYVYICIEGKGVVDYNNNEEWLNCGEIVLIPATLGKYYISGNLTILKIIMNV